MKKQLQGIGFILFGILLCAAKLALEGYRWPFLDFLPPAGLLGLCCGMIGLALLFGSGKEG